MARVYLRLQRSFQVWVLWGRSRWILALPASLAVALAACADTHVPTGSGDAGLADAGQADSLPGEVNSDAASAPLLVEQQGLGQLDLGDTALQEGTGLSPWLRFKLPPGARSLTVTALAPGIGLAVGQWQDGAGKLQVVPSWLGGSLAPWLCLSGCVQRQAGRPSQQSAWLVADTPEGLPTGLWQLRTYGFDPHQEKPVAALARVRLDAVFGPDPAKGVLRVNLCLTGALGISAALAKDHPRIQQAVGQVQAIYATAGIEVQLALVDVAVPNLLVEHDAVDAELSELFATGAKLPLAINVFLVEQLYRNHSGSSQPIAGLAGGIPGPPLQVGTPSSGVVVSLSLGPGEDDRLGTIIAHELGHFLGLYHTIEAAAPSGEALEDQLADTDSNPKWLMHWAPGLGSAALSPGQMRLLRASPWLQVAP